MAKKKTKEEAHNVSAGWVSKEFHYGFQQEHNWFSQVVI